MMDPKQRDKCLKEVSLLQSLRHPNIINYLDSFIEENELMIAIEWAEKGDLKRVIKRAQTEEVPIEELKIWEYMNQIASALKHMQEKRIMHRDLKPANIFITADGSLKLGDLGLGRYLSSQTIEAFSRVGTPLYMSPEVLKGSGYDWKSDVWSLGCVVYELACLHSPFRKDDTKMSLYDLFQTISKGEFPPVNEKYGEELRTIVNSMIVVDPEKRLDIDQVVELCQIQLRAFSQKKCKIDVSLVMDDIQEKLKLLDYENEFCKMFKRPPISRIYFALCINSGEQLGYFYDLAYWLMSFNKTRSPGPRPYTPLLSCGSIGDAEEIAKHILSDVKAFGIKSAESFTPASIKQGYGEGVCVIINDLLNRELVRQSYKFNMPVFLESGMNIYKNPSTHNESYEEIDCEMDDDMIFKSYEQEEDYEDQRPPSPIAKTIEPQTEKDEIQSRFIETNIDPSDWLTECKRVSRDLVITIEEDTSSRLTSIKKHWEIIQKNVSDHSLLKFLQKKSETIGQDLDKIRMCEKKIINLCQSEVNKLKSIAENRINCFKKLSFLRNTVASQCELYDKINTKLESLQKKIEQQTKDHNSFLPLKTAKSSIALLKKEVLNLDLKTAIVKATLDNYRVKN